MVRGSLFEMDACTFSQCRHVCTVHEYAVHAMRDTWAVGGWGAGGVGGRGKGEGEGILGLSVCNVWPM